MYEKSPQSLASDVIKKGSLVVALSALSIAGLDELQIPDTDKINLLGADASAAMTHVISPDKIKKPGSVAVTLSHIKHTPVEVPSVSDTQTHHTHHKKKKHVKYWYGEPAELKVIKQIGKAHNAKLAHHMALDEPWYSALQMRCLDRLWYRESKFDEHALNPSGAYGIPQAEPGSKMASAGKNWQHSATVQINWGFDYIEQSKKYRVPCGAWNHSQAHGWY